MNLSQSGASRSRNVDAVRVFFPVPVDFGTFDEARETTPTSSYGWKFALQVRIWSGAGPKGSAARSVLSALLWSSDEQGRTWLGMPAIMEKSGLGNERTVRRALAVLTQDGWLEFTPQTWASLTAEQLAAGRKAPRRGDVGQAPNLYRVLASPSPRAKEQAPPRPGLTRTTVSTVVEETPQQICLGGQEQICLGGPEAHLPPDPDPLGSVSRMESEQSERGALGTHDFSIAQGGKGDWGWLQSWQLVVQAHVTKTKSQYGLAPMDPDLKRGDRKALAECLDSASSEVAAKLHARGMARELVEVRRELVERAMGRYFRNDTAHLRKTKHALRDLPREWHARITEAMQVMLRESHDNQLVRRPVMLEPTTEPTKVETAPSAPVEKPMRFEETKALAQKAREMLEMAPAKEVQRPQLAEAKERPTREQPKAVLPEWLIAELAQEQARKQEQKGPEPLQNHRDESEVIERPLVRPGAPRWGTIGPRPTKVRRVSRPVHEPEGPGEGEESPLAESG